MIDNAILNANLIKDNPEMKRLFSNMNISPTFKNKLIKKNSNYKVIKNNTIEKNLTKKKLGYKLNKNLYLSSKSIASNFTEENKNELLSLNNAALNVQNLISGYLNKVDKEDKKKFEVDKELKEIKFNKKKTMKNLINLYTKEIFSNDENEEKRIIDKNNNYMNIPLHSNKSFFFNKNNSYGIPGYNNDCLLEKNRTFSKELYQDFLKKEINYYDNNNLLNFKNNSNKFIRNKSYKSEKKDSIDEEEKNVIKKKKIKKKSSK